MGLIAPVAPSTAGTCVRSLRPGVLDAAEPVLGSADASALAVRPGVARSGSGAEGEYTWI